MDLNARIIITGGAGLIGSELTAYLVRSGFQNLTVVDDFSKGRLSNLAAIKNNITIRVGNLEDFNFARVALTDCDVLFHLASRAYGIAYGNSNQIQSLLHNDIISNNILAAIHKSSIRQLIIVSSSCVYDETVTTFSESSPLFEGTPERGNLGYGWAKRFLEQKFLMLESFSPDLKVNIVRPLNIYGESYCWAGQYSQAIPMLVRRIAESQDGDIVSIWGSGNQRRSYVHAEDCARFLVDLARLDRPSLVVNIGTDDAISVRHLGEKIAFMYGRNIRFEFDSTKPSGMPVKKSDMTEAKSLLPDFKFQVSLDAGLERMKNWYNQVFQ